MSPSARPSLTLRLASLALIVVAVLGAILWVHEPSFHDRVNRYRSRLRFSGTDTATIQAIAVDPGREAHERLGALRALRSVHDPEGRSDEVVVGLLTLLRHEDPFVRADVFRQLDGVETPELEAPLLAALRDDASWHVRSEAAETLASFAGTDHVQAALLESYQSDPNPSVRREARSSLEHVGVDLQDPAPAHTAHR